ncbi:MAG: LPS-assembly protein LptD [Bacteroidales bacterium]|nr:LPS-assembly protein LptD [Bacteroidales bacterium]MBQ5425118.1 LPS-assembly protein LptD [Bacteroidales bacterium]MBQ6277142.1 LPS-assembly protein LptD [Bacteroidales bacterium]
MANTSVFPQVTHVQDTTKTSSETLLQTDTTQNITDSLPTVPDSLHVDTIAIPNFGKSKHSKSKDFDVPVYYNSDDSLLNDMKNRKAFLYGNAVVKYEDMTINAAFIEVDLDKKEVYAYGRTDGDSIVGKPEFNQGDETFVADTIRYNFNSKKGIIKNVTTVYDGAYLIGGKTKLHENKHIHMTHGKFTTCDLPDPHFYFNLSKAIVIPDDKIISGPANLVVEDVPTPIGIPFGFFPNKKGGTSGIIIPEFGDEENRGFFLRNGGYYWAINDYVDLTVLGDIYSKGSWGAGMIMNYKLRYKFNGSLSFKYNRNLFGYRGLSNFSASNQYALRWKFTQDSKANPNSTFSADVNMSSTDYDKYNSYNVNNYMTSTKQSSVSYSYVFPNTPLSMSVALKHSQNSNTGSIDLTLPEFAFNMSRIYPFKRKKAVGKSRFYEKISIAYTMNATNKIRTNDADFFNIPYDSITNGIIHRIPINASFKLFKYTTLTPSFNYNERWYFKRFSKQWNDSENLLETDYASTFARVWDYNASLSWSTTIYGMFNFRKGKVKALRHVFSPNVSFSYVPDFGKEKYKYYGTYSRVMYNNSTGQYDTVSNMYSMFEGLPYGTPNKGGSGTVNINLGNNLEMKLRNLKDTTKDNMKIKLLESFNISTNYNIFADSLRWAPISITARTRIKVVDISFNTTLDPYAIAQNEYGTYQRINKALVKTNGHLVRMTIGYLTVGFSLNSKARDKKIAEQQESLYDIIYGYPNSYVDFNVPWNLRVSYTFRYTKPYDEMKITQTLNVSGELNITKKWKISVATGYDFEAKKMSPTTIDIYRDLHCWEMSLHVVPFGQHKSYAFQINVKASMLQDLKLNKRRSWFDNFYN